MTENGERLRLHPLTPIADSLPFMAVLILITIGVNGGALWSVGLAGVPAALFVVVVGFIAVLGYRYLYWRRFVYWFDDSGDLRIDSGVVVLNERKVALSRLQAVDIRRPLVARLFGLAELRVEVAGAGDRRVRLAYLTDAESHRLRQEMLARAAGIGDEPAAAPEAATVIASVPPGRLFAGLMLRSSTAGLLVVSALLIVVTVMTQGAAGLGLLLVTGGVPVFMVITEFFTFYNFTITKAADGVRLHYGLLQTQAQTVPHGRVAAFDVVEPLLWRWRGWARIRITIAGVGGDDNDGANNVQSVLLPIAPRSEGLAVLNEVLAGIDVDAVELTPAPRRSRYRAPIQWGKLAFGFNDRVFITRRGLVTRHLSVVSHARTQSVSIVQGPYERALRLATLAVDVAPGPVRVTALYFPVEQVSGQALAQSERARLARSGDWASGPAGPSQSTGLADEAEPDRT